MHTNTSNTEQSCWVQHATKNKMKHHAWGRGATKHCALPLTNWNGYCHAYLNFLTSRKCASCESLRRPPTAHCRPLGCAGEPVGIGQRMLMTVLDYVVFIEITLASPQWRLHRNDTASAARLSALDATVAECQLVGFESMIYLYL